MSGVSPDLISHSVTPEALQNKPIPPPQVREAKPVPTPDTVVHTVHSRLSSDLQSLKAQKNEVEERLARHDDVPVDLLTRDFDGEYIVLDSALRDLAAGNVQGASAYLEQQALQNLIHVEEMTQRQRELFHVYDILRQRIVSSEGRIAQALLPQQRTYLDTNDQYLREFARLEAIRIDDQIRRENPHLFQGPNGAPNPDGNSQAAIAVERARYLQSGELPPEKIAEMADESSLDPKTAYVYAKTAEYRLHQQWRLQSQALANQQEQYEMATFHLDGMIRALGVQPNDPLSRNQEVTRRMRIESDNPEIRYQQSLADASNSPAVLEGQLIATCAELQNQLANLQEAIEVARSANKDLAFRSLQRQMSRVNLLLFKTQETYDVHRKRSGNENPPALHPAQQAEPPSLQQPVEVKPVRVVQLPFSGESKLYNADEIGWWVTMNARRVVQALYQAVQTEGISLPFDPAENNCTAQATWYGYPRGIQGQPTVWMEYQTPGTVNGNLAQVRTAINTYGELVDVLQVFRKPEDKKTLPGVKMNMRDDIAQQLTPDFLRRNPGLLRKIMNDLLRYAPPGSEEKMRGIRLSV